MRVISLPETEIYYESKGRSGSKACASNESSPNGKNFGLKPTLQTSTDSNAFLLSGQTFFGVSFNPFDHQNNVFACVGGRKVVILNAPPQSANEENEEHKEDCNDFNEDPCKILMIYEDPQENENFYVCDWSLIMTMNQDKGQSGKQLILAVAGFTGAIKLLYPCKASSSKSDKDHILLGHGQDVNDLKFHKRKTHLLLSASKDYSVRLWNVKTKVCLLVFGGECGHRDEVLSLDIHLSGNYVLSSGMDSSVRIWYLDEDIEQMYEESKQVRPEDPVISCHYPIFATGRIHGNYIDCARFFYASIDAMSASGFRNNVLIISKSIHNTMVIWKPHLSASNPETEDSCYYRSSSHSHSHSGSNSNLCYLDKPLNPMEYQTHPDGRSSILMELKVPMCDIWYIRFCMITYLLNNEFNGDDTKNNNNLSNPLKTVIYCGSRNGKVYVHELNHSILAQNPEKNTKVQDATAILELEPVKILANPFSRQVIRQIAVDRCNSLIVAACDDSRIFIYDIKK